MKNPRYFDYFFENFASFTIFPEHAHQKFRTLETFQMHIRTREADICFVVNQY